MTLRKIFPILAIFIAALCLDSCKSSKQAVKTDTAAPSAGWTRVRVPVTVRISSPANMSVGATVTMIRDTSITVSAKVFGMEVFVAQATNDSILIVDKMHRQYLGKNIADALAGLPFNASSVQDLLTGHPVDIPQSILPSGASCSVSLNGGMMSEIAFSNRNTTNVKITYPDTVSTPFGTMAESTVIDADSEKSAKNIRAAIEWQWNKAKWNGDVEPRIIKLSDKYTRIDTGNITKLLGGS